MQYEQKLEEAMRRLETEHLNNKEEPIVEFATLYKRVLPDLFTGPEQCTEALDLLVDCNYLRKIIITEGNEQTKLPDISGYVLASLPMIRDLKTQYYKKLETQYEYEKKQRADGQKIVKILLANIQTYYKTPLGRMLNIYLMLGQFENELFQNYAGGFVESQKRNRLLSKISENNPDQEESEEGVIPMQAATQVATIEPVPSAPPARQERAVDNPEYNKLEELENQKEKPKGVWDIAVNRYSLQILVRIHFRKYEFSMILDLIEKRKIWSEADLRYVYDTLGQMLYHNQNDTQLKHHTVIMNRLRNTAQARIINIA